MELHPLLFAGFLVVALAAGIFIGAYGRQRQVNGLSRDVSHYVSCANTLGNEKRAAENEMIQARHAAEVLHGSCTNGDKWSDHTRKQPEGLTKEVLAKREADRSAALAAASLREERRRKDIDRRKSSAGSDSSNGLAFVAAIAASDFSSDSGSSSSSSDSGGGGCD